MKDTGEKLIHFLFSYSIIFTGGVTVTVVMYQLHENKEMPLIAIYALMGVSCIICLFKYLLLHDSKEYRFFNELLRLGLHIMIVLSSISGIGVWLGWIKTWSDFFINTGVNLLVYAFMYSVFYLKMREESNRMNRQIALNKERMNKNG